MLNKIIDLIENDQIFKTAYEDKESCFHMVIDPVLQDIDANDDKILSTLILIISSQCKIYDMLLNNIAKYGNAPLIDICNKDIKTVFSTEE